MYEPRQGSPYLVLAIVIVWSAAPRRNCTRGGVAAGDLGLFVHGPALRSMEANGSYGSRACENVREPRKRRTIFSMPSSDTRRQHFWFSDRPN
jgi:hypothetical protein